MRTTREGAPAVYLGVDPTDRYATRVRAIDVCGLAPRAGGGLDASFWAWRWDPPPAPLDVGDLLPEIRGARCVMIDGPQALASAGRSMRACERATAAAGKTPDAPPALGRPFAGFVRSALDLFGALDAQGVPISPPGFVGGVGEVYPGHLWSVLAGTRLPKKTTREGRRARARLLASLGVRGLADVPGHDALDACVAAWVAAAADAQVASWEIVALGEPLARDADGTLREGPIASACAVA